MSEKNYLPELRQSIEQYTTLSEEEWEAIFPLWEYHFLKKGEHATLQGQIEKWFYFVPDGVTRIYYSKDGQEIIGGFAYHGDYSGAYDSFITQSPSESNIQALTDCHTLRISHPNLTFLFDEYKSMERWGRQFIETIFVGFAKRQIAVLTFSAEERFKRLLTQSPQVFQLVPQKHLASYLGMTPETFSRLRRKLMR